MANGLSMGSAMLLVVKELGQESVKVLIMAATHAPEVPIKLATRCHAVSQTFYFPNYIQL